jgi:hypothetical protein
MEDKSRLGPLWLLQVVDTAWYLGKIMHTESTLGAWARDRLLK